MKMKFYKKLLQTSLLVILFAFSISKSEAQNQGLYADTIKWPNSNAITVNIKSQSFSNVVSFQGSIHWDKNSLQFVSQTGGASVGASNFTFGTSSASQGILTYLFFDAVTNHTVPDGTTIFSMNFLVINNPLSTYNDNVVTFSNTPTAIGIDTAADLANLSDLATLNSPNLERHTAGFVSFARPPVLSYAGGDITDSVSNRPAGCSYQWLLSGSPVTGPNSSTYASAPAGSFQLVVTYPNGTKDTSLNTVLPIKLSQFIGKSIENVNQLSWSTSVETNTNNFEIERSENGRDFISIGTQKAIGNSSVTQNYSFIDANINGKATLSYRLKINDNNGVYVYSSVITISKNVKTGINLYPNPSKGNVYITGEKMQQIVITDILGKTVLVKELGLTNNASVNTTSFAKGFYSVTVKTVNSTEIIKLLVD